MSKYYVFILFLFYSCSNYHGLSYDFNFHKTKYEELFLTQCLITFGHEKPISEFVPKKSENIYNSVDYENINRTIQSLVSTINLQLIANSTYSRDFYLYTDHNVNFLDSILLKSIPNRNIQCHNKINPRTKSYLVYWMKSRNLDESSKILCEFSLEFLCNNSQQISTYEREKKVTDMISIFSCAAQFTNEFNECCLGKNFEICSDAYFNWFLEDVDGGREYSVKFEPTLNQESKNRFDIVSHEFMKIIKSNDFQKMADEYSKRRISEHKRKMKIQNKNRIINN